jgi:hypothetical protein
MTDVSHYRKRPFYVAKMTENGDFLSQTAFFRANAIADKAGQQQVR